MADETSPVLHRAALERVLLRAAELQASGADIPEALSEAELVAAAGEVGISPAALRQALAEERMRVVLPEEKGMLAALAGPASFATARQVPGAAREVLANIDRSFQREENLLELRRFPNRVVWGPRGGIAGVLRTFTRFDGRGFPLVKADEVSASVSDAGQGRAQVRIEASLETRRSRAAWQSLLGVAAGAAGATALTLMSVVLPVGVAAGAIVAAASVWLSRRGYRRDARAAQLALEQALDRLEFGAPRPRTLLDQLLTPGR